MCIEYIYKPAVVAEIENRINKYILLQQKPEMSDLQEELQNKIDCLNSIKGHIINTIEVKEVDIDKMLYHRRNIGFTYPEGASGYQKRLVCYRQGIEDVLKALKGK